ncbi:MAG: bifunctional 4-hydroxy-2-oxoglutarate aldolase/2-dehydro-3-deoxy-phosphogluconate aldolase [Thermoguttaceae bacterium]|nr:bifunctional 4-hydroxy-2-oxoglutarate aldolase/2-dehydro-3-deoxy-phosphogluconate aldolase [Thermoguttaceae bacterium]
MAGTDATQWNVGGSYRVRQPYRFKARLRSYRNDALRRIASVRIADLVNAEQLVDKALDFPARFLITLSYSHTPSLPLESLCKLEYDMSENALELIEKIGLLPLVNVSDPSKAAPIAQALSKGGIDAIEVTLRDATALESLANARKALPNALVGAGSVHNVADAERAIDLGADFIVAPGVDPETIQFCQTRQTPVIPGAVTATEIEQARALGLSVVKFFPADILGGVKAINALRGPFADVRFVPTGGINLDNMTPYAENKGVYALGGSFLTPSAAVAAGDWDAITSTAERAVDKMLGFTMGHVGVNCPTADAARAAAEEFAEIFRFSTREIDISFFGGSAVEAMKKPSFGEHGHIAIATNSMKRAIHHLERRGYSFRFFKNNDKGEMIAAYITNEIGGFAIHLCVKY